MNMKNFKETKLSHLTKVLNGNYHCGLNIEHAKPVLEKDLIVNSLFGEYQTATEQAAGKKGGPAGLLVHVSNQI